MVARATLTPPEETSLAAPERSDRVLLAATETARLLEAAQAQAVAAQVLSAATETKEPVVLVVLAWYQTSAEHPLHTQAEAAAAHPPPVE